ncbi:MAG: hypothetical protein A2148_03805 [Chloroflexi bacterium RBG_16_68_14]|nr:MAG: hypothetical protein A2148_03805 [Chloroflexi bacterium RBG_16_68_14]
MDAELWTAVAVAVIGPTAAVILGVGSFWVREERQKASQRYLDDGAVKLLKVVSARLSIYLLNYQTANYSIRLLKTYEPGGPLAPGPEAIPGFLDVDLDSLPIDVILPVQELVGDDSVMKWVVEALSDVTLFAKEVDFQIRQPLAAYFRGDPRTHLDRQEAVKRLSATVDAWATRLHPHFALLGRLHDLITHVERRRPWTFGGYSTISRRHEVEEMRKEWRRGYGEAQQERKKAEPVLRSGGVDAEAAPR